MHWKITTVLICIYGIVKEFRPATPFLTPFLVSNYKNLSLEEVYGEIYPFWTYSYMICLVPIFFLTDILHYKPVIVLEAGCLCATWAVLVWGQGVRQMQIMQIIFGLSSASEIAYYSYIYVIVEEKNYKKVTSYIRSAALFGKLMAFSLAQVLISTGAGSYLLLNQISFGAVSIVFFISLALPGFPVNRVERQIQVGIMNDGRTEERRLTHGIHEDFTPITRAEIEKRKLDNGLKLYFITIRNNFDVYRKNRIVLKWSIWWSLASCGMYQIYNYMQTLWVSMQSDLNNVENGIVECANTFFGAVLSFVIHYLSINWSRYGEITLFSSSIVICIILALLSQTSYITVAYVGYVCITSIYHMLISAASANIASELTSFNYGLVFGWNTFVAVLMQAILTFTVADVHGLNLSIRIQFAVYSGYFGCVGVLFLAFTICELTRNRLGLNKPSIEI